jgi:hypothetical protein
MIYLSSLLGINFSVPNPGNLTHQSERMIYSPSLLGINFNVPNPGNLTQRLGGLSEPVSLLATLFLSGNTSESTSESGIKVRRAGSIVVGRRSSSLSGSSYPRWKSSLTR